MIMIDNLFCHLSRSVETLSRLFREGVLEILSAALIIVNVLIIHEVEDRFHVRNYHKTFRSTACNVTLFECQTRYRWRYIMTHWSRKKQYNQVSFSINLESLACVVQERSVYMKGI